MNCNHRRLNIALYCGSIYKNMNNRKNIKNIHPWHMIVCSQGVFLTTKQQEIIIYSVMYSKTDDHRLYACHTYLTLISFLYHVVLEKGDLRIWYFPCRGFLDLSKKGVSRSKESLHFIKLPSVNPISQKAPSFLVTIPSSPLKKPPFYFLRFLDTATVTLLESYQIWRKPFLTLQQGNKLSQSRVEYHISC